MEEEISLEQLNPEPNVVQGPKADYLKIGLLIFAGLVLLSAAAYAGYWYASRQQIPPAPQITPVLIQKQPTPTPLIKDETADWKTYTNTKYGYTIKYPKSWEYVTESDMSGIKSGEILFSTSLALAETSPTQSTYTLLKESRFKVNILVIDNTSESELAEYFQNKGIKQKDMVSFSNTSGITGFKKVQNLTPPAITVWISRGRYIIQITAIGSLDPELDAEVIEIFNLILQTFQFTD